MKRELTSCFLMLMITSLSLQAADNYQAVLQRIAGRVKEEEGPSLFVGNLGIFPTFLCRSENVIPLSDFLQLKKDSQNIVSVLRACQRGDSKRARTNSKKLVSIVGSPQCFEAYFGEDDRVRFIVLGSIEDINTPNSILQKALEYIGHRSSKASKSAIALGLALTFDASHETRAATIWYQRSIQNGSTVVAPYYMANLLNRESERLSDEQDFLVTQAISKTYKFLAETKGHLSSIRAFAESLENEGKFVEAVQWYKKAVLEKGHMPSIGDMIRCLDELWAPWSQEGGTAPDAALLQFIKESYELSAYKFGDEEAGNRLADLMKELDDERDDDDCYSLEKEVLAEQIALCPDKVRSNTMLRLALLNEESYCMACLKGKRDLNKIYDMFLPAAQAGNFAAMIKLYHLSSKKGDVEKKQLWSDELECLYRDIFGTARVNDALLYLAYLGVFGEDLLEYACSELRISSNIFKEAAEEYSFKPSVDPTISGFPATEFSNDLSDKDIYLELGDINSEKFEEASLDSEPSADSTSSEVSEIEYSSVSLDKKRKREDEEVEVFEYFVKRMKSEAE